MTSDVEVDETVNVVKHECIGEWKVHRVGYHDWSSIVKVGRSVPKAFKSKGVAPELVATE